MHHGVLEFKLNVIQRAWLEGAARLSKAPSGPGATTTQLLTKGHIM